MLRKFNLIMVLVSAAIACATASQVKASYNNSSPHVIVTLDGGDASRNFGEVLVTIQEIGKLPAISVFLGRGDTVCGVLSSTHYPPPCGPALRVIQILNPAMNDRRFATLQNGDEVIVPDIAIKTVRTELVVPRREDSDRYVRRLIRAWAPLNSKLTSSGTSELRIAYSKYVVNVAAKSERDAREIGDAVAKLRLDNVTVDAGSGGRQDVKFYNMSQDVSAVQSDCKSNLLGGSTREYDTLSDEDQDAVAITQQSSANPAQKPSVHIIDTHLDDLPNLALLGSTPATTLCSWAADFDKEKQHANVLASIIASQPNGTGFKGVWPNVELQAFDITKTTDLASEVSDYIEGSYNDTPLPVYLFSLSTRTDDGDLPSEEARWSDPLAETIKKLRPLAVVAAGQAEGGAIPDQITAKAREFPQNLGDLPNVVVVTACTDCKRGHATLMQEAYSSEYEWKFIQIAAPGGLPIVTWTSPTTLGASHGTSQSAAYVAGIAASMISSFPLVFREAVQVKYRLQTCSYPLPVYTPGMTLNPDTQRIATGVVDPAVCLLDPQKTWLKKGNGWEQEEVQGWTPATSFLVNGHPSQIDTRNILRVLRINGKLTIYTDRTTDPSAKTQVEGGLGQVRITSLLAVSSGTGLILCNGSTIPVSQMVDYIPAVDRSHQGCHLLHH